MHFLSGLSGSHVDFNPKPSLQKRVRPAAERALKQNGSVEPLELFNHMGFLQWAHIDGWHKGNEYYPNLEQHIQAGPEKFEKSPIR